MVMGSQKPTITSARMESSAFHGVRQFVIAASKLALRGLIVAIIMGVIFGLLIGFGGTLLGVETERLYIIGGMSGWVSSFIAILFVLSEARRGKHTGQ